MEHRSCKYKIGTGTELALGLLAVSIFTRLQFLTPDDKPHPTLEHLHCALKGFSPIRARAPARGIRRAQTSRICSSTIAELVGCTSRHGNHLTRCSCQRLESLHHPGRKEVVFRILYGPIKNNREIGPSRIREQS